MLEQLVAFAECGSLSKAAEKLLISQPALSRSMKRLEDELSVAIFDRSSNRMSLNENGLLALEYAKRILSEANDMKSHVQAFDRRNKTILIGSVAPAPLWLLLSKAGSLFSESIVSSEINGPDTLYKGLLDGTYSLVVLAENRQIPGHMCVPFGDESLLVCFPEDYPLATKESVSFEELDGIDMLLMNQIGIWDDLVREKMPHSKFLIQSDRMVFVELAEHSSFPIFVTRQSYGALSFPKGRVSVPISDLEATKHFYVYFPKQGGQKFLPLFRDTPSL